MATMATVHSHVTAVSTKSLGTKSHPFGTNSMSSGALKFTFGGKVGDAVGVTLRGRGNSFDLPAPANAGKKRAVRSFETSVSSGRLSNQDASPILQPR